MTDVSARLLSVRDRIDRRLVAYLKDKLAEVRATSPDSVELAEGVDDLTMRGGKRLRPIVLDAAYRAVKPDGSEDASTGVGAALEVLQSYLLIHDDWMDQDDERRGGPAVHKIYERKYETHIAASLAILAGDLACAYAWELFFESPFPAHRQAEANARFVTIQKEVIVGQHLDCTANPDVSRMHDLKTRCWRGATRSARPSSWPTTCSAPSATSARPASRATTSRIASAPAWSPSASGCCHPANATRSTA